LNNALYRETFFIEILKTVILQCKVWRRT